MRIKNYKLFLESLNKNVFLDEEYILHGYLTPLYDKYFEVVLFDVGYINEYDDFRKIYPGKNVKVAYFIELKQTKEDFAKEDIEDCYNNIFIDEMVSLENIGEGLSFLIAHKDRRDVSIEEVCKYIGVSKEVFEKTDEYLSELIGDSTFYKSKFNGDYDSWYNNQNDKWILEFTNSDEHMRYSQEIEDFLNDLGLTKEIKHKLVGLLLENILNIRIRKVS